MTVTYTHHVASSKGFGCFWKLLFRWRGSIYKLVWPDLVIYILLYGMCSIIYRTALNDEQKRLFEKVSIHCQQFADLIPVAFVLGFYVSIVVQRWWDQYLSLPWPDALALFVSTCISGQDKRSRLMRRTIMRYVNLTFVITLSMISPRVKKRFPTLDHVLDAGFLTDGEKKIFDDLNLKTSHPKYWMPLVWAGAIVTRARKEGRIRDDFAVKTLVDEISKFRGLSGGLLSYDWISIPLVYTQVVTLAVYTFFLGTIMGRQFLVPRDGDVNNVDMYVPWFTFLQFFFYMGWLKVAESLVNPFGEDDDDFEVNWLIDRNLQVSYLIVDEMHEEHPELIQDRYWDEVFPQELPYTVAAEPYRRMAPQGSTFNMQVPEAEQEMFLMPLVEEDERVSDNSHIKINMNRRHGSRESIESSTSAIAMKSRRNSIGTRKESVLSMFINRVLHSTQDTHNRRFSRLGSSASMRRVGRTSHRLQRTTSHDSTSQSHHSSHDGLAPHPSSLKLVSSATGRGAPAYAGRGRREEETDDEHSPAILAGTASRRGPPTSSQPVEGAPAWGASAWPTTRRYERQVSMDEEGAIFIRIKPEKRSENRQPPTTGTGRPGTVVTASTTATVTCSASTLHTSSMVLSVPSTAAHRPVSSVMPSFTAPKLLRSVSQKYEPTPNDVHHSTPPTSPVNTMGRMMSQELGSDEDSDSGDSRHENEPLLPSALPSGLPSSPEIDDQETLDGPSLGLTGTVRRNRKPLLLSPLVEGPSYCDRPTSINKCDGDEMGVTASLLRKAETSANAPRPQGDSLEKPLEISKSGGDNPVVSQLVACEGISKGKHGFVSVEENLSLAQKTDTKSKPVQHLTTSPSLKRSQPVSPFLYVSDEEQLVDGGASHAVSATIDSRFFSEHSATTMSLSKRFANSKEGPRSPMDFSDASPMSSVFSRKSVSLEGLQEDKEGEAYEEQISPRSVGLTSERPVSAPVKQSVGDQEAQFVAKHVPHFPSQIYIDSVKAERHDGNNISSDEHPLDTVVPSQIHIDSVGVERHDGNNISSDEHPLDNVAIVKTGSELEGKT